MKQLIFFTLILLLVSCKQKAEKAPVPATTQQVETTEESHESVDAVVTLNNGKLWLANPETTIGINHMKKRMRSFTEKESIEDYAKLKVGLEADFTELFEKCTMKGEAHNQLHNYLFPFIDLFDGLGSSELTICKKSFSELNNHLDQYSKYFE